MFVFLRPGLCFNSELSLVAFQRFALRNAQIVDSQRMSESIIGVIERDHVLVVGSRDSAKPGQRKFRSYIAVAFCPLGDSIGRFDQLTIPMVSMFLPLSLTDAVPISTRMADHKPEVEVFAGNMVYGICETPHPPFADLSTDETEHIVPVQPRYNDM